MRKQALRSSSLVAREGVVQSENVEPRCARSNMAPFAAPHLTPKQNLRKHTTNEAFSETTCLLCCVVPGRRQGRGRGPRTAMWDLVIHASTHVVQLQTMAHLSPSHTSHQSERPKSSREKLRSSRCNGWRCSKFAPLSGRGQRLTSANERLLQPTPRSTSRNVKHDQSHRSHVTPKDFRKEPSFCQ